MAKKSQTSILKKLLIVGVVLAALELIFILTLSGKKGDLTPQKAINDAVNNLKDVTPERKELARVQLALSAYMRENNGTPPDTLQRLVPKFFDRIPSNPSTGKPFPYRVEGNRYFIGEDTSSGGATSLEAGAKGPQGGKSPSTGAAQETPGAISEEEKASLLASLSDDPSKQPAPYTSTGKRDPFRPVDLAPRDDDSDKTPLEQIAIDKLVFSAFLESSDAPKAIVEDQNGRGFTVTKGTRIGPNKGEVTEITPDKIVVVESEVDFTGELRSRTVEIIKGLRNSPNLGQRRRP